MNEVNVSTREAKFGSYCDISRRFVSARVEYRLFIVIGYYRIIIILVALPNIYFSISFCINVEYRLFRCSILRTSTV